MELPGNLEITNTKVFDHLGLIAATIKEINLVQAIDQLLPVRDIAKTTHGQRVAAMIYNAIGFLDVRLYIFPKFMETKPVEKLFGPNIEASFFNDSSLGRTLDAIHEFGETDFFQRVALQIALDENLFGKTIHLDTTTLSLFGDYDNVLDEPLIETATEKSTENEPERNLSLPSHPIPAYGFAKNKRIDLKQMVLLMASTGPAGLPIYLEVHSGNASDKKTLEEAAQRVKEFCGNLKNIEKMIFVGDSAMYENCVKKGQNLTWLSRVPATNKLCNQALAMENATWIELPQGYKMYVLEKENAPEDLRWILFFSQEAYKREIKTLEKNILEDLELAKKTAKSLEREEFSCEKDIPKYIKKSVSKIKFHTLSHTVESVEKHSLPGRPSKDSKPDLIVYKVIINIEENKKAIEIATLSKGKFILATNADEETLKNEDFLNTYKNQASVESGFRFIKDNTFEVDSVFVKKPGRVSALMVIMVLTLLIYRLAEYKIRKKLLEEKKTVTNQKNKQVSNPSMKWICKLFYGVSVLNIKLNGQNKSIVMNMNEELKKITRLFGEHACWIYDIEYGDG